MAVGGIDSLDPVCQVLVRLAAHRRRRAMLPASRRRGKRAVRGKAFGVIPEACARTFETIDL
jgi:hypothetical protein